MANTRIVLNKQSDLILTEAQIVAPVGIVEADIAGLVAHFQTVEQSIATEVSDRGVAITAEESSRIAGDEALQADLETAIDALSSADSSLESKVNDDVKRLEGENKVLSETINTVDNAAITRDASLEAKVSTEKGRIDAILSAATADSDSFAEIVTLINSVDTENDQAFASYVLSNNAALSTEKAAREDEDDSLKKSINNVEYDLDNEIVRAKSADASLESKIDSDVSTLEEDLEAAIAAEESTRLSVDEAIIATIGYDDRGEASGEAFDNYASEVGDEVKKNGSSPFAPINEVNFEAWKAAREDAQLKEVDAKLEDAIVTLEEDYISEDDKIIAAVGYRDRGDSSAVAFETYASEVRAEVDASGSSPFAPINEVNFEAWKANKERAELIEEVATLENAIEQERSNSVVRDSEIIASIGYDDRGDSSAVAFETYASEVRAEVDASGSSPFAPINEVNFEAWKANKERAELIEEVATLENAIEQERSNSVVRDSEIIASIGYDDRGSASEEAFDNYAGEVGAEVKENGYSPFAPINEVNFEAWKADKEQAELGEQVDRLNKTIQDVEDGLSTSLGKVVINFESADASLEAKVSTEKGRIDAILSAATADSDSFAEIVTLINSVDTENDQAFASYVLSNNAALSTEKAAREVADNSLETKIEIDVATESGEREAADASLESKIDSADSSLESKIDSDVSTEVAAREAAIAAEESTRLSVDEAIKTGVNAALVEIKDMLVSVIQRSGFTFMSSADGDGVTTTFTQPMYGSGALYLNGLLQIEGFDYTVSNSVDGKGNPVVDFIFNTAPDNGSKISIFGRDGAIADANWYGDATPLA